MVDPGHVRFVLREPWPDFITFYGTTASGAGWIVPKKYVEKIGDDAFKSAPVGAGPYKVVSFKPGVELVLEAFDGYWRKAPVVKRLVMRSMPEETTRAAALKAGEVDVAYLLTVRPRREYPHHLGLRLAAPLVSGAFWLELPGAVGSQIALVRPARAAGRQPRHRSGEHQPGGDARVRPVTGNLRAADLRVRRTHGATRLRSREGEEAPRRGRLSERLRQRRLLSLPTL